MAHPDFAAMRSAAEALPLLATWGFLFASVSPISVEMVRSGLLRGFWPALGVGLGACSGDAIWALARLLNATGRLDRAGVPVLFAWLNIALLLLLAVLLLRDAWRGGAASARGWRDGAVAGYFLGLALALTDLENITFWISDFLEGRRSTQLVARAGLLLGALAFYLALVLALALLRRGAALLGARFTARFWPIATQAVAGLLMLLFAASQLWFFSIDFNFDMN